MTLVDAVTALSERLLRERTFELIVAPAIADLQFDEGGKRTGARPRRHEGAVIAAFAWGLYEDATSDSGALLLFAALTLLPAAYYTALVVFFLRDYRLSDQVNVTLAFALVGLLSLGPAIACYWPERPARPRPSTDA